MKFGICAPYQDVAALQEKTFDYLEENVQRFLVPEQNRDYFEQLWQEARTLGKPIEACNSMLPANLPIIETPTQHVDTARLERYIKTMLERAEQVGVHRIVFGSGDARRLPPDCDYHAGLQQIGTYLATWSEWAQPYGVQIALEPLRYEETNVLNTINEGGALVTKYIASGATLLIDTYHMACNGEAATDIAAWVPLLSHVHVAEKQERAAPGRYGEDLRPYFRALHEGGYDQRISIECRWQDFAREANTAIKYIKQQWIDVVNA